MHILFLQSSFDKTAPNIQRRILKLMKSPQSQMTVKICSAECAHDEVSILRVILKQGEAGFRQRTGKGRSSTRLQLQYSPTHVVSQRQIQTQTRGGGGGVSDVRARVQQAVSCLINLISHSCCYFNFVFYLLQRITQQVHWISLKQREIRNISF